MEPYITEALVKAGIELGGSVDFYFPYLVEWNASYFKRFY